MFSKTQQTEFVNMINNHRKLIYKICHLYCSDKEYFNDIVQEVLVNLWNSYPNYNPKYKHTTWIYRIALNTAISFIRKEKKHYTNHYEINHSIFQISDDESGKELENNIQQLYKYIDTFNSLDKALLLLYLEDNSYDEISEILGITVTNVATKLSRLKIRLKELFNSSN